MSPGCPARKDQHNEGGLSQSPPLLFSLIILMQHRNDHGGGGVPRPRVSELPVGVGLGDKLDQQKFLLT
jgi:hypothetical protein